jgi:Tol biopolymer transport system component
MILRLVTIVLAVAVAVLLPLAIQHLREEPPAPPPAVRLTLSPPPDTEFGGASLLDLAVARSGREIVFAATTAGQSQLWRQRLDAQRADPLPGTAGATLPSYSADGSTLWYFTAARLRRLDLATGRTRDVIEAPQPLGTAVRHDGTVLVGVGGPIRRLGEDGSSPVTTVRADERTHAFPAWAGVGDAFVYLATLHDGRRVLRMHDAEQDVELARADSHGIVAEGHLLYVRDGLLRAQALDLEARHLAPRAHTLAIDVGVSPLGAGAFAVGGHVLATGPPARHSYVLRWFTGTGQPLEAISEPGDYWQLRLSPDERTVAVTMRDRLLGTLDVFTVAASGGVPARLTLALAADSDPVWSSDGRRIAFRSAQEGEPHIFARSVASSASADEPVWRSPLDDVPTDWSLQHLVFHARSPGTGSDIFALPPGGTAARPLARTGFNEIDGRLSPDGRWLAYASDEGGQFDIYVSAVDDSSRRVRVTTAGGTKPQWVDDTRALVFTRGEEILRVPLGSGTAGLQPGTPTRVLLLPRMRDVAASRHGTRLLVLAPADTVQRVAIDVVAGWTALVR